MTEAEERKERHSEIKGLLETTLAETKGTREEVGALSTAFALHEQKNEHDQSGNESRLGDLEDAAEATGQHKLSKLESALRESQTAATASSEKWRGRAWAIFASLAFAGFTGLVTHWLSTR